MRECRIVAQRDRAREKGAALISGYFWHFLIFYPYAYFVFWGGRVRKVTRKKPRYQYLNPLWGTTEISVV